MDTMKGLVFFPDGDIRLEEVPVPRIGDNPFSPRDVLVEVEACGICGSDIHKWLSEKADVKNPARPVVGGHEIVSVVRSVGPEVKTVKPGDRVVHEIVTFYCGTCPACKRARAFGHADLYLVFGLPTGGGSGRARARFQTEYIEAFMSARREAPLVPFA